MTSNGRAAQRYGLVFRKLGEAAAVEEGGPPVGQLRGPCPDELDEIDELRRLSQALKDPEPESSTTT